MCMNINPSYLILQLQKYFRVVFSKKANWQNFLQPLSHYFTCSRKGGRQYNTLHLAFEHMGVSSWLNYRHIR